MVGGCSFAAAVCVSNLANTPPLQVRTQFQLCGWWVLQCLCQQPGEYSILADQNHCPLGMMVYQGARQLLHKYFPLQAPLPPLQCRNDSVVGAHARRVLQNGYCCSKVGFKLLYLGSRNNSSHNSFFVNAVPQSAAVDGPQTRQRKRKHAQTKSDGKLRGTCDDQMKLCFLVAAASHVNGSVPTVSFINTSQLCSTNPNPRTSSSPRLLSVAFYY